MKTLGYALLGIFVGSAITLPLSSCGPDCRRAGSVPAGAFVIDGDKRQCQDEPESDYRLVVASDRRRVTETFSRLGKAYVIEYEVIDGESESGGGSGGGS